MNCSTTITLLSRMLCDHPNQVYLQDRPLLFLSIEEAKEYARKQLDNDYKKNPEFKLKEIAERTDSDGTVFITAYFEGGIDEYRIDELTCYEP